MFTSHVVLWFQSFFNMYKQKLNNRASMFRNRIRKYISYVVRHVWIWVVFSTSQLKVSNEFHKSYKTLVIDMCCHFFKKDPIIPYCSPARFSFPKASYHTDFAKRRVQVYLLVSSWSAKRFLLKWWNMLSIYCSLRNWQTVLALAPSIDQRWRK